MNSPFPNEEIAADPFAADIFAVKRAEDDDEAAEAPAEREIEKSFSWFKHLPQVARSASDWDELLRGIPSFFTDEAACRLSESLERFLILPDEKKVDFLPSGRREINESENLAATKSWWLSVGVEAGKAEIAFEIDRAFAAWLVDATLGEENTDDAMFREITPSETAILEFLSMNLAHEANLIWQSPVFKFRALSREIPASLRQNLESEKPALLVVDWQTVRGLVPGVVKMYFAPEVLQALQAGENPLLENGSRRRTRRILPNRITEARARILLGDAELSYGELAAIEAGDVVLLENHGLTTNTGNVFGRAEIYLGDAENLRIVGEFAGGDFFAPEIQLEENGENGDSKISVRKLSSKADWQITIENFAETEASLMPETLMTENGENPASESFEENADEQGGLAVENLAVTLRVELEARRLTLAEIGNLRENQILELGISPTDAVNILIDRQIIGRGELVAVSDEESGSERLGVRITKLMR